jgi:hypothetical protein
MLTQLNPVSGHYRRSRRRFAQPRPAAKLQVANRQPGVLLPDALSACTPQTESKVEDEGFVVVHTEGMPGIAASQETGRNDITANTFIAAGACQGLRSPCSGDRRLPRSVSCRCMSGGAPQMPLPVSAGGCCCLGIRLATGMLGQNAFVGDTECRVLRTTSTPLL